MICISEQAILEKARSMPIAYLSDCRSASTPNDMGEWCFEAEAYTVIANRYSKYKLSQADPYAERISGCCDRADQY